MAIARIHIPKIGNPNMSNSEEAINTLKMMMPTNTSNIKTMKVNGISIEAPQMDQ